jgi:hypothetical protein
VPQHDQILRVLQAKRIFAAVRFIEQRFFSRHKTLFINPIGTDANFLQIGRRESGAENAKCTEPFISKS